MTKTNLKISDSIQTPDPVLAEVRRTKVALLEKFNYDMVAMARDARARQGQSGHPVIIKRQQQHNSAFQ